MLWVKKGTHILDHPRFLRAGAVARDLYDWGLLYAGKHETDGELEMVAVLASAWGAGGSANIKVASKLVDVGLWLRTDTGFLICRWAEQGNQTKAQIDEGRAAAKQRMGKRRSRNVQANTERTNVDIPTSTSLSVSSGSDLDLIASDLPTGVRERIVEPIVPVDGMPAWFDGACDATAMVLGGGIADRPALWVQYLASRRRKTWAMDHTDAVGWLTPVVQSQRAKARASPGRSLVQSADNRAWKLPEGGEF